MTTWEERIDEVWAAAANELVDDEVIARIDALAAERGQDDARAEFERAGARDSAGRPLEAIPLYRRALELGLDAEHEPQAIIQLASSLRNPRSPSATPDMPTANTAWAPRRRR